MKTHTRECACPSLKFSLRDVVFLVPGKGVRWAFAECVLFETRPHEV
jgi:hypothetical protein